MEDELIRQGQAYALKRGTFQAALPLLRQPLVCAVPASAQTVVDRRPWDVGSFTEQLLAAKLGRSPTTNPLAYVPFGNGAPDSLAGRSIPTDTGLAAALAVGFGGVLATTGANLSVAAFTSGPALRGLTTGLLWTRYAPSPDGPHCTGPGSIPNPPTQYRFFVGPLARALGAAPAWPAPGDTPTAINDGLAVPSLRFGGTGGWRLAPLPVGPIRPATPTINLDVAVWKDTADTPAVAALSVGLLSRSAQSVLARWGRLLSVQPTVARSQLAGRLTDVDEANWLATSAHDVTRQDGYGTQTDHNSLTYQIVYNNLHGTLLGLTGYSGGFTACYPAGKPPSRPTAAGIAAALKGAKRKSPLGGYGGAGEAILLPPS